MRLEPAGIVVAPRNIGPPPLNVAEPWTVRFQEVLEACEAVDVERAAEHDRPLTGPLVVS